ncbi:MAG: YdcF family protein [Pararhodobacter sp.]|nr:YdcF family protein [Pararhodobacter sp.]
MATFSEPAGPRVALVLGAAVREGGEPSPALSRRAQHAAALWRAGRIDAVIGTGGVGRHPPAEADVIARLCRQAGLPEGAIHAENHSTSTRENIAFAQPVLARLRPRETLIVTDSWHAPRARLVARQVGLRAQSNCPQPERPPWRRLRHILREGAAILAALMRLR